MKFKLVSIPLLALTCVPITACNYLNAEHDRPTTKGEHAEGDAHQGEGHGGEGHPVHKILVTSPIAEDVTITQKYVCQIHSSKHIEMRALESGYLEAITVNEGQAVKQGQIVFKILPNIYQAKLDAERAEAKLAEIELKNTKRLYQQKIVSEQQVALADAKLAKAVAQAELAEAEFNFTEIKAPFNGIIDRLFNQQGSLVAEGDILTTLSDNSVMWVYFNVPEARYLEYKAKLEKVQDDIFIIESGVSVNDKIILEGIRQVRDGEKIVYEFRDPAEVLGNLKNRAE